MLNGHHLDQARSANQCSRTKSAFRRLGLHIGVALVLLLPACHSARTVFIRAGDGQAFAQAVADFGGSGQDTVILLPPGTILSLANVTFPDAVPVSVS